MEVKRQPTGRSRSKLATNSWQSTVNEENAVAVQATVDTDTDLNTCSSVNDVDCDKDLVSMLPRFSQATQSDQHAASRVSTEDDDDFLNLAPRSQFTPPDGITRRLGSGTSSGRERPRANLQDETVVLLSDKILSHSTEEPYTSMETSTHSRLRRPSHGGESTSGADTTIRTDTELTLQLIQGVANEPSFTATGRTSARSDHMSPATKIPLWSIDNSEFVTQTPSLGDALWKFGAKKLTTPAAVAAVLDSGTMRPMTATEEATIFLDDAWSATLLSMEAHNPDRRAEKTLEAAKCSSASWSSASVDLGVIVQAPFETDATQSLSQGLQFIEVLPLDFEKAPPKCAMPCPEGTATCQSDRQEIESPIGDTEDPQMMTSSISALASHCKEAMGSQVMAPAPPPQAVNVVATDDSQKVVQESMDILFDPKVVELRAPEKPTSLQTDRCQSVNREVGQLYAQVSLIEPAATSRNTAKDIFLTCTKVAPAIRSRKTAPPPPSSTKRVPSVQPASCPSILKPEKLWHSPEQSPSYHRDLTFTPDAGKAGPNLNVASASLKTSRQTSRKPARTNSKDAGPTSRVASASRVKNSQVGNDSAKRHSRKTSQPSQQGELNLTETTLSTAHANILPSVGKTSVSRRASSRLKKEPANDLAEPQPSMQQPSVTTSPVRPKSKLNGKQLHSVRGKAHSATTNVQPSGKTSGASEPKRHHKKKGSLPNGLEKCQQPSLKPGTSVHPSHFSEEELSYLRDLTPDSKQAVLISKRHSSMPEPRKSKPPLTSSAMKLSASNDKDSAQRPGNKELREMHPRHSDTLPSSLKLLERKNENFRDISNRLQHSGRNLSVGSLNNSRKFITLPQMLTRDSIAPMTGHNGSTLQAKSSITYQNVTTESDSAKNLQPLSETDGQLLLSSLQPNKLKVQDSKPSPLLSQSDIARDPKLLALLELTRLRRKIQRTVETPEAATPSADADSQRLAAADKSADRPRQLMQALQAKSLLLRPRRCLRHQLSKRLHAEPTSTATEPSSAGQWGDLLEAASDAVDADTDPR